jgi:hypothetical protein
MSFTINISLESRPMKRTSSLAITAELKDSEIY